MDAHTNLEQMDLNDVVGVFVSMDCPATVFQCLLGYNWVRFFFYLESLFPFIWIILLVEQQEVFLRKQKYNSNISIFYNHGTEFWVN